MKMKVLYAGVLLCVGLMISCSKESSETLPEDFVAVSMTQVEYDLLKIVNEHRISMGVSALESSAIANQHASQHNDYMIRLGSISHDNFSARASSLSTEFKAKLIAENVGKDYGDAEAAFQGWLNSADHRKTMEGNFSHTGLSVKKDSKGTLYFTQIYILQ